MNLRVRSVTGWSAMLSLVLIFRDRDDEVREKGAMAVGAKSKRWLERV